MSTHTIVLALIFFPLDIWNVYYGMTKIKGIWKILYLILTGSAFMYHGGVILYAMLDLIKRMF